MATPFHKMHGAGNDFVLLDLRTRNLALDAARVRGIAKRHTGVGCDQLLTLHPPQSEDHLARLEIWNADGGRAEQCGNGVRCVARYLADRGEAENGRVRLRGPVGDIEATARDDGLVEVVMGLAEFRPARIPLCLEGVRGQYTIDTTLGRVRFGAVSMGNPHAVVRVDDTGTTDVAGLGAAIGSHEAFPQGCNVGFAQLLEAGKIRLRVFERGAGETRACGSGACAAVAVLARDGGLGSETRVIQAGGELIIGWNGPDRPVHMTGPAVYVFEGNLP